MQEKERALEAYLVASARLGDRRAMSGLVRLRGPRLLAHATRLLGERDAAHDVVQEAWAEILRGLKTLKDDRAFLPWALRITSRRVSREIERRQRHRRLASEYGAEMDTSLPDEASASIDAEVIRTALNELSDDHRATIALFYLEEMSVADVAAAMDVPLGTVKTRLMHARAHLRRVIEGEET